MIRTAAIFVAGVIVVSAMVGAALWLLTDPDRSARLFRPSAARTPDKAVTSAAGSPSMTDSSLIGYRELDPIILAIDAPHAIATGPRGTVYAAGANQVQVIDHAGAVVRTIDAGETVFCLAADETGRVYTGSRNAICRYSPRYERESVWRVGGEKTYLTSIAVGEEDVFAADAGMRLVWRLDHEGQPRGRIGEPDSGRGIPGLIVPSPYMDVAIGRDGSLWVVNPGRHLVENYRPTGDRLWSWGTTGMHVEGFSGCCGPIQMALLPDGSFVTAEKGIKRIKVHDPAGRFTTIVAPHSAFTPGKATLDLAVDSTGTILVLDTHEKRIRRFRKKRS